MIDDGSVFYILLIPLNSLSIESSPKFLKDVDGELEMQCCVALSQSAMLHCVTSQLSGVYMQILETIIPLRDYCRDHKWPRLPQWHHWIYAGAPIAKACVKKIGGRYLVDLLAFQKYVESASLEEKEAR